MNNETLIKMREENEKTLKKIEEEKAKRKRYEELLSNPLVQEFLSLQDYKDFEPILEKERIDMIKPLNIRRQDSNHIYVDQGTYVSLDEWKREYLTFPNDPEGSYRLYRDLETGELAYIPIIAVENFEKEYLTIHISGKNTAYNYSKKYYVLQEWFFKELLTKPQKEVIESLKNPETINNVLNSSIESETLNATLN